MAKFSLPVFNAAYNNFRAVLRAIAQARVLGESEWLEFHETNLQGCITSGNQLGLIWPEGLRTYMVEAMEICEGKGWTIPESSTNLFNQILNASA